MTDAVVGEIDIDALRTLINESDINLFELRRNIDRTLETRTVATIAEVLADFPATQGLGTVIGLLYLALERSTLGRAMLIDGERDLITWSEGVAARVPAVLFVRAQVDA